MAYSSYVVATPIGSTSGASVNLSGGGALSDDCYVQVLNQGIHTVWIGDSSFNSQTAPSNEAWPVLPGEVSPDFYVEGTTAGGTGFLYAAIDANGGSSSIRILVTLVN